VSWPGHAAGRTATAAAPHPAGPGPATAGCYSDRTPAAHPARRSACTTPAGNPAPRTGTRPAARTPLPGPAPGEPPPGRTSRGQRLIDHLERHEPGQLTQMSGREHPRRHRHRPGDDTLIQQRDSSWPVLLVEARSLMSPVAMCGTNTPLDTPNPGVNYAALRLVVPDWRLMMTPVRIIRPPSSDAAWMLSLRAAHPMPMARNGTRYRVLAAMATGSRAWA
jgi:hypothetical protein